MTMYLRFSFATIVGMVLLCLSYTGFAQVKKGKVSPAKSNTQKPVNDDVEACVQLLKDFTQAYSDISEHQSSEKVLAFFTPSLVTEIITINIKGNIQNRYTDYRQFSQYLDGLINTRTLKIRYSVDKILHAFVKGNFGIIVYETSYEILRDGESLIKGTEVNTANLIKSNNRWRINYYTIYDIAANQQRGSCQCEIFKGADGKYVTRTSYPSGTRYEVMMDNFTIGFNDKIGGYLIRVRDLFFVWKRTGSIVQLSFAGSQPTEVGEELGVTDDEQEMLLIILRAVLFSDNCISVRKR